MMLMVLSVVAQMSYLVVDEVPRLLMLMVVVVDGGGDGSCYCIGSECDE